MKISIREVPRSQRKQKPLEGTAMGFGRVFTDHMFLMDYDEGRGWYDPRIEPYHPFSLDPAALVLHYGQEVFEGLKAYRWQDGGIHLFRPRMNYERLNRSAVRLCMPEIDVEAVLEATRQLARLEKEWVPSEPGTSLYLRPNMIAVEAALGVRISSRYLFYIIATPVGAYYTQAFDPVDLYIMEEYTRGGCGGSGGAKTLGNYALGLLAQKEAHQLGYTQVLWLDPVERKFVEEMGTSNIFFSIGDELITPALTGSILAGITRDSVIQVARDWGLKVVERKISIDEVILALEHGRLKEVFGSGTATVISPVGKLAYREKAYPINGEKVGPLARKFYDTLTGIQYGKVKDPYGWVQRVA
jgi:branched-chain amino acid aminotransferase